MIEIVIALSNSLPTVVWLVESLASAGLGYAMELAEHLNTIPLK